MNPRFLQLVPKVTSRRSFPAISHTLPTTTSAIIHTLPPPMLGVARYHNPNFPGGFSPFHRPEFSDDDETLPWSYQDDMYGTTAAGRMMKELKPAYASGSRADDNSKGWEAIQQKDALYIKMDMPGVSKENVKVYLEGTSLVIKGERMSDPELKDDKETYSGRFDMMMVLRTHNIAEMKAEMKNGVLKVKVPKIKDEERQDILHVKVA